jgi:hypothetical protein
MLTFLMVSFRNFSRVKMLAVYGLLLGGYFVVIFVAPEIIHGRFDGLTAGQLGMVTGMALVTNVLIQVISWLIGHCCGVCDSEEFQSVLAFEEDVENHYSAKLNNYSAFKT